jgi:large subunit ribosomal protein L4
MEQKLYNKQGEEIGTYKPDEKIFGFPWNRDLVRQVFLAEQASRRQPIAHTKDRAEVSGGGKKPWQQKGTGRARHGSIRSPIWIGGGITHGPRNKRDYSEKVNDKVRRKALLVSLSQKLRDHELIFVDDLKFSDAKTKNGAAVIKKLPINRKYSTLVVMPSKDQITWRALRNIKNLNVREARNLNTSEVLSHKFVIMDKNSEKVWQK